MNNVIDLNLVKTQPRMRKPCWVINALTCCVFSGCNFMKRTNEVRHDCRLKLQPVKRLFCVGETLLRRLLALILSRLSVFASKFHQIMRKKTTTKCADVKPQSCCADLVSLRGNWMGIRVREEISGGKKKGL